MKILAIDYGIARTGVATCDPLETIASPLCVIPSYITKNLLPNCFVSSKKAARRN